jgi:predicted aspartyl protease
MIRGTVNYRNEAIVSLRVRTSGGTECDVDLIIDTAFTGTLTLPPVLISSLNLAFRNQVDVRLGDGTMCQFDTYDAEVEWDGVWVPLVVTEIDADPLLGMGLLAGHEVFIEFVPGGVVDITKLP